MKRDKINAGGAYRAAAAAALALAVERAQSGRLRARSRLAGRAGRKRRRRRDRRLARAGSVSGRKRSAFRSPSLAVGRRCAAAALAAGQILGESINLTRRLVNEPPRRHVSRIVRRAGRPRSPRSAAWRSKSGTRTRLEAERCGSLLAVARGSSRPPRLVILRYRGGKADHPPLAIVGKGVTFDSGGLSLKPTDGMLTMKCDMAGAATMLGAMRAIALVETAGQRRRPGRPGRKHDRPGGHETGRRAHRPQRHARSKSTTPTPKAGWCWPTC